MQLTLLLYVFAALGGCYADRYFPVMNATYRLLNRLLDNYEQKTAEIITNDIKKVEESTQQIETATRQVSEKMDNVIQSVMNSTRVEYAKAEEEAKSKNVDVSKCLEAALIVSMNSNQTKENALSCTKTKAAEGMKNVQGMKTSLTELLEEFKKYRVEGDECVVGVDSLIAATRAFWCLEKVKAQALSTRFIKLPSIKRSIRKQANLLASLPKTIADCSKEKEASKFAVASQLIGQRINTCINDYIKKSTETSGGSESQGATDTTADQESTKPEKESNSSTQEASQNTPAPPPNPEPELGPETEKSKPVVQEPSSNVNTNDAESSKPSTASNEPNVPKLPEAKNPSLDTPETPASDPSETPNEAPLNTSAEEKPVEQPREVSESASTSNQPKPPTESNSEQPKLEPLVDPSGASETN